jgi:hypothetical protein
VNFHCIWVELIVSSGSLFKPFQSLASMGLEPIRPYGQGILSPQANSTNSDLSVTCDGDVPSARSRISSETETDSDLRRLLDAWPSLSAPIRAAVLALIETESA